MCLQCVKILTEELQAARELMKVLNLHSINNPSLTCESLIMSTSKKIDQLRVELENETAKLN